MTAEKSLCHRTVSNNITAKSFVQLLFWLEIHLLQQPTVIFSGQIDATYSSVLDANVDCCLTKSRSG